ncbi:hypothetical protein Goarm_005142, partial [Gossypium armourianum]|nr:hypothetical protein [Gossypium armourianum]
DPIFGIAAVYEDKSASGCALCSETKKEASTRGGPMRVNCWLRQLDGMDCRIPDMERGLSSRFNGAYEEGVGPSEFQATVNGLMDLGSDGTATGHYENLQSERSWIEELTGSSPFQE